MDLILWRHAEAQDADGEVEDLSRSLTRRGEKQAVRMAQWLDAHLTDGTRILVSPARRTEQTALILARRYRLCPELLPGCSVATLLALAQWPDAKHPVLVVGHQPTLGQVVAELMGLSEGDCAVRKGAVWWLRHREREAQRQTVIVTVQTPELLN